ncbi:anoctamin-7 isoform X1 [Acipenser ruthenus]|uniref:anoctamin-7 isoform X1 n=1 Tax=Acipenser ruthenus TaxID=7906 RepID=UPI00145B101D|nr:anoctamin-7 isoform X1 [Acipenser ruthenus]
MYSEGFGTDRDLLLDLGPVDQPDCYGSIENGSFMGTRYLDEDDDEDPIYIHGERGGTRASDPHRNFFRDGRTKIDFVLVWEVRNHSRRKRRARSRYQELGKEEQKSADSKETKHSRWRDKFVRNLQNTGLLLEKEETVSDRKTIHYLKLSAPWDVLVYYAEELCLRAPLQAQPNPDLNSSDQFLKNLWIPNIMSQSVPKKPVDYYTCAFRKSKMAKFLGCEDHDTYFTNTQRHRIVYEILARTAYGKRKRAEIGIDRLLNEGAYSAAFPLHEGPFEISTFEVDPEQLNSRQVIFQYWGRWSKWYKYQPLDHIREYFGEKIAIYFAWLGFYTAWLLPAAVMGTFVFISGIISMGTNTPAEEICSSGGSYHMCPLCEACSTWNISDICSMAKLGYLFDHPGTVFFSVFMSLWAVTFLEYWKRKNATLAHHWDCMDFQEEEERPRPEFAAMAPTMEQNPVTGVKEPYFPEKARLSRMLTGSMVIVVMLCVVMIFLVTVIMYRGIVSMMMYHTESIVLRTQAGNIANISSSMVNLALILLMGQVYTALAEQLTKWEMHRTQTQYEDAFTFKVFVFQFVNFYSSPFYVAFFKGRFVGYPGHYGKLFGMRNEDCGPGGCLIELAEQLFIIMVGKQIINNIQEFVVPKVKAWLQKRQIRAVRGSRISQEPKRWEEDYELIECEGLFEEYLEMVLQFGFITIFVAAFPLAPLFALLNNWVEIRLDAQKFVCEYRRPVAERAQDIGVWFNILEALSHLSVIVNAFLIAFTSDFLPRLLYQYKFDSNLHGYVNFTLAHAPPSYMDGNHTQCRYKSFRDDSGNYTLFYWELLAVRLGFIIAFEHVVFLILRAIDWIVPDVPESLALKIKRERYLAKQALADNQDAVLRQATFLQAACASGADQEVEEMELEEDI